MNSNLLFDFVVNKENNRVLVKREFAANLDQTWDAWTKPEILDQWWAPKPYQTVTKSMDFSVGGRWLYYMQGPEGNIHWCKNDYKEIDPKKYFKGLDAFCDEHGEANPEMPRTLWTIRFMANGDTTTVDIVSQYETLEALEMVIKMGFKEGFSMALENLDNLFASK